MYKRFYSGPYLLCIHPEVTELLLEELHEGIYGSHTEGRSLSHRAITQRYWWLGMQKEALEYVKKCDQCQRFAPNTISQEGSSTLCLVHGPSPSGGLDIVGPFSKAIEIRDICWSAQITSPSGSKLSHWPTSKMLMLKNSSGETLLHDSGSLEPSFQTMHSNLIAKPLKDIVANWGSQTGTQLQLILRETSRPKLSTRS